MDLTVYLLTPTYIDSFALGAYIALFPLGGMRKTFFATLVALAIVTFAVLSWSQGIRDASGMGPGYVLIWGYSFVNVCTALAIDCLICNKLAPRFFNAAVMRYLGKISYGVYVFHWPVQNGLRLALPHSGLLVQLSLQLVITFSLAAASYTFWEKPFLSKRDTWFRSKQNVHLQAAVPQSQ
jgi:peptidoglycan/LPS O-acetylase OafA/YrhL